MEKCSICLEGITNSSKTNCNHHFCSDCLNDWLSQNKNTCPICRTKLESFITNDITTKIITINSNSRNIDPSNTIVDIVDIDPIYSQFIRDILTKYTRIRCFLYLMTFGFTYTLSKFLSVKHANLELIEQINLCEYNLTSLGETIYYGRNNILVYDDSIHRMRNCIVSDYYYNQCFP